MDHGLDRPNSGGRTNFGNVVQCPEYSRHRPCAVTNVSKRRTFGSKHQVARSGSAATTCGEILLLSRYTPCAATVLIKNEPTGNRR